MNRTLFLFLAFATLLPLPVLAQADLQVMSFNIRYGLARDGDNAWPKRKNFVADTIRSAKPDILGTQECLHFQMQFLEKELTEFDHFGRAREVKESGERCELFWKHERFEALDKGTFMLSPTPDTHGSQGWDAALPRIATWAKLKDKASGKVVFVLNTHFDHRGTRAREESAKLIRAKADELAGELPIICMGDLNFGPGFIGYKALSRAPWKDTYRAIHPTPGSEEGTFSGFKGRKNGSRIDYIFSKGLHIRAAAIDHTIRDGRNPSDHFPVTARLSFVK